MQVISSSRQTYRGITRAIFSILRKKAVKRGLHVIGPNGEAAKDGIKIHWNYDPSLEQLDVECVGTPFWIDANSVNQNLRNEIESVLGQDRAA